MRLGHGAFDLGYTDNLGETSVPSVAVEFDTWNNGPQYYGDYNDNHVAVDPMSMTKGVSFTPSWRLMSAQPTYVWIDYDGLTASFKVFLAQADVKPASPAINMKLNLSVLLNPANPNSPFFMGFTAAGEDIAAIFYVQKWCPLLGKLIT